MWYSFMVEHSTRWGVSGSLDRSIKIVFDGPLESLLETPSWLPAECFESGAVECVSLVVSRPVLDELDEIRIGIDGIQNLMGDF